MNTPSFKVTNFHLSLDEIKNGSKDDELEKINFADLIRSQVKKYTNRNNEIEKLAFQNERDLFFLQKDHSFINSNKKNIVTKLELEEKRKQLEFEQKNKPKFDIYNTKVYETQNPNIGNLLKEIGSKSNINQLQDELKKEFDKFLSFSIENSKSSLRNTLIKEYNLNQEGPNIENRNECIFITQENTDDDEIKLLTKRNSEVGETLKHEIEKWIPERKNNQLKKTATYNTHLKNDKNMQIALAENKQELILDNSSLIKLNKIIEGIKRVDLPKFQPELHQICQYATDSEILKVYSEVN